ncbi:MAG: hydrogenase expression/formation protein HypE [Lachnospiraceae bacterium]|nr:hydrogenase expression/formation protein HypE [Lachnospiraceae bacterium]
MEDVITLDYGSGGGKTSKLISDLILPLINKDHEKTGALCDGAVLDILKGTGDGNQRLVFSTDSFVVDPRFFPGGDIGKLSVCGTVNDLAMMGAEPAYLSLSFIIEEGFSAEELKTIAMSIGRTAKEAGVRIVTGDTKVVDRGRGDGIYINTSGIGFVDSDLFPEGYSLKPENICAGDSVIVSGTVGDHGTAVMLARNPEFGMGGGEGSDMLLSDCAPLNREALALARGLGKDLRVMRDPTRGGLATALNEFVEDRQDVGIEILEKEIPISDTVRSICDILGLDPLYCACEGRLIAVVSGECEDRALSILKREPHGSGAAVIGHVTEKTPGRLVIRTVLGTGRIAVKLSGAQLPRIC